MMWGDDSLERPRQHPEVETYLLPDGTCLLFDNRTEMGHVLNTVGALVWDYCDGTCTVDQIAGEVASLLPDTTATRDQVRQLVSELRDLHLVLNAPEGVQIRAGARGVA
jgi:Coenzyme PQQ synthesis protein D (PqqD)